MKRNIKIILLIIIIIFLSIILVKIYDTDINPVIKNETIIKQNKMLTMMFESQEETGVYEANDEESSFDQSGYYFNPNLSGCEHGGTVSYKDNKVTMQSSYTDKCFVYFSTTQVGVGSNGNSDEYAYRFHVMLQTDGSNYEESTFSNLNNGSYVLNNKRSYCSDNVSFTNSSTNITLPMNASNVNCYFYYDLSSNFADYIIKLYEGQVSEGSDNIYYHDGVGTYSSLEAGDNSYRYVGSNPNNYVCFGYASGNESVCNDTTNNKEYLYRIIGAFKNSSNQYQVKLIKYDFATTTMLGTNGESSGSTYAASSYANYRAKNLSGTVARYYWSRQTTTYSGSTYHNIWSISPLNTINLNTNYISYLNTNNSAWTSMIATTSWKVGGNTLENIRTQNAKTAYTNEITNADSGVQSTYPVTNKIGLMYVSDYMYAANPIYWSKYGYYNNDGTRDYRAAINDNWMYMGVYEWTVSRQSDYTYIAFIVDYTGSVNTSNAYYSNFGVRPSFYLESSVENVGIHSGTREDPYILDTASFSNEPSEGYILGQIEPDDPENPELDPFE